MQRWILLVLVALSTAVSANWMCGTLSVEGEALLLRPTTYRPYTAIVSPDSPSSTFDVPLGGRWEGNTKPPYEWGYRIGIGYEQDCYDLRANWSSWIHTNVFSVSVGNNCRIFSSIFHPLNNDFLYVSPGALQRRDQFKVQSIDGELGRLQSSACSRWTSRLFGGVRYTRIRYNVAINLAGTNSGDQPQFAMSRWVSDIQGTGPRIGIGGSGDLFWGLKFLGDLSASLLLSSMKGSYLDTQRTSQFFDLITSRIDPTNMVIGNAEVYLGFGYNYSFKCIDDLSAEIGYRISYYTHGTIQAQFIEENSTGISSITTDAFALDGFVFKLGVSY